MTRMSIGNTVHIPNTYTVAANTLYRLGFVWVSPTILYGCSPCFSVRRRRIALIINVVIVVQPSKKLCPDFPFSLAPGPAVTELHAIFSTDTAAQTSLVIIRATIHYFAVIVSFTFNRIVGNRFNSSGKILFSPL